MGGGGGLSLSLVFSEGILYRFCIYQGESSVNAWDALRGCCLIAWWCVQHPMTCICAALGAKLSEKVMHQVVHGGY